MGCRNERISLPLSHFLFVNSLFPRDSFFGGLGLAVVRWDPAVPLCVCVWGGLAPRAWAREELLLPLLSSAHCLSSSLHRKQSRTGTASLKLSVTQAPRLDSWHPEDWMRASFSGSLVESAKMASGEPRESCCSVCRDRGATRQDCNQDCAVDQDWAVKNGEHFT